MHINQTEPSNGFNLLYTSFLAFEDITISLLSEKVILKNVWSKVVLFLDTMNKNKIAMNLEIFF